MDRLLTENTLLETPGTENVSGTEATLRQSSAPVSVLEETSASERSASEKTASEESASEESASGESTTGRSSLDLKKGWPSRFPQAEFGERETREETLYRKQELAESSEEIPEKILGELELSANVSASRRGLIEIRLESVQTSPFLVSLASALERFLDIFGEPFEFSPEKQREGTAFSLKRPKTFQGIGFAVTFPFAGGIGVFLAAKQGDILPSWFANPGIAGISRIQLLAGELEALFSDEEEERDGEEAENRDFLRKNERGKGREIKSAESNRLSARGRFGRCYEEAQFREISSFYSSRDFFHGRIDSLEKLFEMLPIGKLTAFRSFSIRKFDGREGSAWFLGPLETVEPLYANSASDITESEEISSGLKPVRSLESVLLEPIAFSPVALGTVSREPVAEWSAGALREGASQNEDREEGDVPKAQISEDVMERLTSGNFDGDSSSVRDSSVDPARDSVGDLVVDSARDSSVGSARDSVSDSSVDSVSGLARDSSVDSVSGLVGDLNHASKGDLETSWSSDSSGFDAEAVSESEEILDVGSASERFEENSVQEEEISDVEEEIWALSAEEAKEAEAEANAEESWKFRRFVLRIHFRTRLYSPKRLQARTARILSQIRYAHPANTQRWRERTQRIVERIEARLQSAFLFPATVSREQSRFSERENFETSFRRELNSPPALSSEFSVVETSFPWIEPENHFESVQITDFSGVDLKNGTDFEGQGAYCQKEMFVSAEYSPYRSWTEYSPVLIRTLDLLNDGKALEKTADISEIPGEERPDEERRDGKRLSEQCSDEEEYFTAETLLEKDEELSASPTFSEKVERSPFEEDFSEHSDALFPSGRTPSAEVGRILDIPVSFSILLGRSRLPVSEILGWKVGTILNLGQKATEMAEVCVNGSCAGKGFPVEYENYVGVKLRELTGVRLGK